LTICFPIGFHFLAYPNLFGIKGFVVVVVVVVDELIYPLSLIFEIFDLMLSDWVSFLDYPNLFGIKSFVVVVVDELIYPEDDSNANQSRPN
jgi:hypothetical protein